jgi:hypothetical protein
MKVLINFLILIFVISQSLAKEKFTVGLRYRGIECVGDNVSISFDFCNVKAFSAKVAVLNIGINYLETLQRPIIVQIIYFYRFGTIYRSMIDSKKFDLCAIMNGIMDNKILNFLTRDLVKEAPHVLHKCPYEKGEWIFVR